MSPFELLRGTAFMMIGPLSAVVEEEKALRFDLTAVRSNLNAFSSSTTALSGPIIMNAVPRSNTNGLTVPAMFAVKPQFFENGTTTISVTFTVTAP